MKTPCPTYDRFFKSVYKCTSSLLEESGLFNGMTTYLANSFYGIFGPKEQIFLLKEIIEALSVSDSRPIMKCVLKINQIQKQALEAVKPETSQEIEEA